jgi:hypothetical protein
LDGQNHAGGDGTSGVAEIAGLALARNRRNPRNTIAAYDKAGRLEGHVMQWRSKKHELVRARTSRHVILLEECADLAFQLDRENRRYLIGRILDPVAHDHLDRIDMSVDQRKG